MTQTFIKFISDLLRRGGVGVEWVPTLTQRPLIDSFLSAVTHPSIDKKNNFETFEFFGDTILNYSVVQWVQETQPQITNIEWLARIKSMLISTKIVAQVAEKMNISEHVRFDTGVITQYKSGFSSGFSTGGPSKGKGVLTDEYLRFVEDVVEALCGCIVHTFVACGMRRAVGVEVCQNILFSFLNEVNPQITKYEVVWDPISRIKEMYDTVKWPFGWIEVTQGLNITVSLRWWPSVNLNELHPLFKQKVIDYCYNNRVRIPNNGVLPLTREITEGVRGNDQRYQYDEKNRIKGLFVGANIPHSDNYWKKQWVSYFGPGIELVSGTTTTEFTTELKYKLSEEGIEILKKHKYEYRQPPPISYVYKPKKQFN